MVDLIIRILVGAMGALLLMLGVQYMIDPATIAAQNGIGVTGDIGTATLRADVGGFFCGAGGLALAAAIRNRSSWLLGPLVLIILALVGRIITLGVDGTAPGAFVPMVVEAAMIVVFGGAMIRARA